MELDLSKLTPSNPNSHVANLCKSLLDRKMKGEITTQEFELEIAFVSLETLEDLKYTALPAKPTVLHDFERNKWRDYEQKRAMQDKIMDSDEVKVYYQRLNRVVWKNVGEASWLEHLIRVFVKAGDKLNAAKVWEVYKYYPESIDLNNQTVWTRKTFTDKKDLPV